MPHLLHIDSSFMGENSVSRALSARAVARWQAANPDGTVTYRDFALDPPPHLIGTTGVARMVPAEHQTPAQAESYALTKQYVQEIIDADVVVLGLPLYNYGAPSTVKAWVDHIIAPGLSTDHQMNGLLGGREFLVTASRGGGYGDGTPKAGWDHAEAWLPHGLSNIGLEPRFITAELTLANVNPAMESLKPLAAESLAAAEAEIDALWQPVAA